MEDAKRRANEKKFGRWMGLSDGGRRYWYEVVNRTGWKVRYVKEVDSEEETTRFAQEIYDASGRLTEVHEKYPVDLGHRKVE